MANSEIRVVDQMLFDYADSINKGFGFINNDVTFLASVLIAISLVMAGLFWALKAEDVMVPFLKKILLIGFFAFLINNWLFLTGVVMKSFVAIGFKAGGDQIDSNIFFSPAQIAGVGLDIWLDFAEGISGLTGPVGFFENFDTIMVMLFVGILIILAFFVMAVQIFVTLIMFKLVTLAAFVLVPFGLLKHTSFMSERALGLVVSYGLKFMTLSIILSIGYGTFMSLGPVDVMNMNEAFALLLAALVFMMLSIHAPGVASELITGGPQIGAGSMAGAALGGAGAIAVAGWGATKLASGGGSMAKNQLIKAAGAGNIEINGKPMSQKNSATSLNTTKSSNSGDSPSTFHNEQSKSGNASPNNNKGGKSNMPSTGAVSALQKGDSGGGISSTNPSNHDDGE